MIKLVLAQVTTVYSSFVTPSTPVDISQGQGKFIPGSDEQSLILRPFSDTQASNIMEVQNAAGSTVLLSISASGILTVKAAGLKIPGAGAGIGTLAYANSATSGTLTFPAVTDTLAVLGTAQSFTAVQTFGNNISFGGATLNVSALATGQVIEYNGTNWVNLAVPLTVSNSDGTLTISPTTGAVVASLALGHANTWTGAQTFNAALSFGNVSIAPTVDGGANFGTTVLRWNNIIAGSAFQLFLTSGAANPIISIDSTQAIRFGAGGASALDNALSRLTSAAGTGLFFQSITTNSNTFVTVAPNGTGTNSEVDVAATSDVNTNVLWLRMQVSITGVIFNIQKLGTQTLQPFSFQMGSVESFRVLTSAAFQFTTGTINLNVATTLAAPANTANALKITDGTNAYLTIDTRTGVPNIAINVATTAPSFASASAVGTNPWSLLQLQTFTFTLTGTTTVATMHGLMQYIQNPTITNASANTVTATSTVYIAGAPIAGGSVTITNPYSLYVNSGASGFGGSVYPLTDNSTVLGLGTNRWSSVYGVLFNVLTNSGDANPSSQLSAGTLKFGAGGASALDTTLAWSVSLNGSGYRGILMTTGGSSAFMIQGTQSSFMVNRVSGVNYELLNIGSDINAAGEYRIRVQNAGTGLLRPLIFDVGGEVFRITVDPYFQFANGVTGAGSALLGSNSPAVTNTAPYTWWKVKTADGSIGYIPVWK